MKKLQKRSTAWLIFAIVLVVSLILGLNLSVSRQAKAVKKGFYEGVFDPEAGYRRPAIARQLENRIDAALGLITCCSEEENLQQEVNDLRNARLDLLEASSPETKYLANVMLDKTWATLAVAMDDLGIDVEAEPYGDYFSILIGSDTALMESGYNASVSTFYRSVMGSVPVSVFRFLIFVDLPEYFGVEG